MIDRQFFPGDLHDHPGHLVDGNHLLRADVYRTREFRFHQVSYSLDALVDIEERTRLLAIPPKLYLSAICLLGDLAAQCGRRLFPSSLPGALRSEDVVEPGYPYVQSMVP